MMSVPSKGSSSTRFVADGQMPVPGKPGAARRVELADCATMGSLPRIPIAVGRNVAGRAPISRRVDAKLLRQRWECLDCGKHFFSAVIKTG